MSWEGGHYVEGETCVEGEAGECQGERESAEPKGSASDPLDLQGGSLGKAGFYEGSNCSTTRAI